MNQTPSRESFLKRVREAVQAGNQVGQRTPLPRRGELGYQGGGTDLTAAFRDQLSKVGGQIHTASSNSAAVGVIRDLLQNWNAKSILLGRGEFLDALDLRSALVSDERKIVPADQTTDAERRELYFAADVGISGVDFLIAETGTIVVTSKATDPRSVSLLPPRHIAVAHQRQLAADLFDVFQSPSLKEPPANLALITGPSKTGDIELRLVTGVHGPKEVHVVLLMS